MAWEDVPKKGWEDVEKYGAASGPGTDAMGEEVLRYLKAARGGYETAGSMITKIPGYIASGYRGMLDMAIGQDPTEGMQQTQDFLPSFDPVTEEGKAGTELVGKTIKKAAGYVGDLTSTPTPFQVLGDNPNESEFGRTAGEFGTEFAANFAPLGPKYKAKGLSPEALAHLEKLKKEQVKVQPTKGWEDVPKQGELDLQGGGKGGGEPPNIADMMERSRERMDVAEETQLLDSLKNNQPDMFGEAVPKESFPGMERSTELQRQKEGVPYEDARLDPSLQQEPKPQQEPFQQGNFDFPLRQEAIDKDPYIYTLRDEYAKWLKEGNDAKAAEVLDMAKNYLKETYNVTKPDHFAGQLWADEPKALEIEKTERPVIGAKGPKATDPIGRTLEKSRDWRKLPGNKQKGIVDFTDPRDVKDRLRKLEELITDNQRKIQALERAGEHTTSSQTIDRKLESLYYEQMRFQNEKLRLLDDKHPLHAVEMNKGPIGKQRGTIDLGFNSFMKKALERNEVDRDLLDKKIWSVSKHIGDMRDMLSLVAKQLAELSNKVVRVPHPDDLSAYARGDLPEPRYIEMDRQQAKQAAYGLMNRIQFELKTSDRLEAVERQLELSQTQKGRKQAGAIDLRSDPEFLKFKDSLPEALKGEAKAMWKKMQEDKKAAPPAVIENAPALEVLDGVPGLKTWKDEIAPITKTPQELKPIILKEADLGGDRLARVGRQLVAGGKLLGFGTQNTLVRYVVQVMDRAIRESTRLIDQLILNKETGFKPKWEKLSDREKGETWAALAAQEGKMDLGREQLFDMGLNEKQVDAAMAFRDALDRVYDILNEARASRGKKPFEKRLGYIPSRFRGDFIVEVRDAEGGLVHRIGATSLLEADKLRDYMRERHPELTFGETKHEGMHRFKDASDVNAGYQELISILEQEDPRIEAIESTYQDYLNKQAYDVLSIKKHFWNKKGVGGAEGFKEWESALENAHEGLRSTMNYMDHALKWSEVQKNFKDLHTLMKDEGIREAQPNALRYSQAYIDQSLGRSTRLARSFDGMVDIIANQTGIGQSLMLHGIRETKAFLTAVYLGFWNLGFSLSQMLQVVQTIPAWMIYMKDAGAKADMMGSFQKGAYESFRGFALGKDRMSPLSIEAWDYAKQYGIVEAKILEDVKTVVGKDFNKVYDWLAFKSMTYPEKLARTQAYMSWVHFLDSTKEFKTNKELFETAANMTDMTMVDYRNHERSMLYKQFGIIGESANALTTFKHNYFSQAWALNERSRNTDVGRTWMVPFIGMQLMLAGVLGVPGRDDLDGMIKMLNKLSPTRIPNTREMMMHLPDLVSFGGLSSITGLDLSGKFSIANVLPDDPMAAVMPFASTIGQGAKDAYDFLWNPSVTQAMRGVLDMSPQGPARAGAEQYFTKDNMYLDPHLEGKLDRSKGGAARWLGLRSMDESKEMNKMRTMKESNQWYADRRTHVLAQAKDALFENRREELRGLAQKYYKYEGSPSDFVDKLVENVEAQKQPATKRMLIQALQNPEKFNRLKDAR